MSTALELRDADAIAADVDRGIAVFAQIEQLKEELKAISARLEADALARPDEHEPLKDAERDGRQFVAIGTHHRLPLIVTADKLMGQFKPGTANEARVMAAIAPDQVGFFFQKVTVWENQFDDGQAFRREAQERLGPLAPAFIGACLALDKHGIPKCDIKIEWKAAAAHAHLEGAAS